MATLPIRIDGVPYQVPDDSYPRLAVYISAMTINSSTTSQATRSRVLAENPPPWTKDPRIAVERQMRRRARR